MEPPSTTALSGFSNQELAPNERAVSVLNETERRLRLAPIRRAVALALARHALVGEVCVLLTTDDHVRELNRTYRNRDEVTDVLTFPSGSKVGHLGDVAIAASYAERQAKRRRVSMSQELAYLAIHGALHLADFDDESDQDRAEMQREMNEIAVLSGLSADPNWTSLPESGAGAATQ